MIVLVSQSLQLEDSTEQTGSQQLCCPLFQAAWKKRGNNKRSLWEEMRTLFQSFVFASMRELYEAIVPGIARQKPVLNSS